MSPVNSNTTVFPSSAITLPPKHHMMMRMADSASLELLTVMPKPFICGCFFWIASASSRNSSQVAGTGLPISSSRSLRTNIGVVSTSSGTAWMVPCQAPALTRFS